MSETETQNSKLPSPVRLTRVETFMAAEPKFKGMIKPKSVEVHGRKGVKLKYSQAVIDVALAVAAKGLDPASCSKADIMNTASEVLAGEPAAATSAAQQSEPASATVEDTGSPDVPPVAETAPAEPGIANNNHMFAVSALLMSAMHLLSFDKNPGAEKRKSKMAELIEDCNKLLRTPAA